MRRFKRFLRFWHRWLGLVISLLLMYLAITGWLLNHSEDWQWSNRFVQSTWFMRAYGIAEPTADVTIALYPSLFNQPALTQSSSKQSSSNHHWLSQWQQKIFVDQHLLLADFQGPLVAVLVLPDVYLLATQDSLQAVNPQGQRIWQLDGLDLLPSPITGLVVSNQQIILQTPHKNWLFDAKQLSWQPAFSVLEIPDSSLDVIASQSLPMDLQAAIVPQVSQKQVSWQQVLLDLHSGRLFKAVVVMDITAWLLLVLSISGLLLFFRRRS